MKEMNVLNELNPLLKSPTIRPTFNYLHIILALFVFDQNPDGIGRYRLQEELLIGSGTVKSLVSKLREIGGYIEVPERDDINTSEMKRKGHVLTKKGKILLKKIKSMIPILDEGDISILKDTIIGNDNLIPYYCLIKNAADRITNGVEQRDASIKVNGSGATCLIYNGESFIFPSITVSKQKEDEYTPSNQVQEYFKKKLTKAHIELIEDDVIIIGSGINDKKARLAALNAALTLIG